MLRHCCGASGSGVAAYATFTRVVTRALPLPYLSQASLSTVAPVAEVLSKVPLPGEGSGMVGDDAGDVDGGSRRRGGLDKAGAAPQVRPAAAAQTGTKKRILKHPERYVCGVSVVREDPFARRAADALQSLLGSSGVPLLSNVAGVPLHSDRPPRESSSQATEHSVGDVSAPTAGPMGAAPEQEDAGEARDSTVSFGEEELLEDRGLFADAEEAPAVVSHPSHGSASPLPVAGAAGISMQRSEKLCSNSEIVSIAGDAGGSAPQNVPQQRPQALDHSQELLNLSGSAYHGDIAEALQQAAVARGFTSPFWSSSSAFKDIGGAVIAKEADGVLVPTSQRSLLLFNLEQTDLWTELRGAAVNEVLLFIQRQRQKSSTTSLRTRTFFQLQPRDVTGRMMSPQRSQAISTSPLFHELRTHDARWVTAHEIEVLCSAVKAAEVDRCIKVPFLWNEKPSAEAAAAAEHSLSTGADDGRERPSYAKIYNVSQLVDADRFAAFSHWKCAPARCFGSRGSRYAACTTWLMWEYCKRYHFPLTGQEMIVFLTAERIRSLGGTVLKTLRYTVPRSCDGKETNSGSSTSPLPQGSPTTVVPSVPDVATAGQPREERRADHHSVEGEREDRHEERDLTAASFAVTPPPFTVIMNGEVVTLYHAGHTNIFDTILQRVKEMRERRALQRQANL